MRRITTLALSLVLAVASVSAQTPRRDRPLLPLRGAVAAYSTADYDSNLRAYRNLGRSRSGEWGSRYLNLTGASGTYASVPDEAALSFNGDFRLTWWGTMPDWTPASPTVLIAKYVESGNQRVFFFRLHGGVAQIYISTDGVVMANTASSAVTLVDGTYGAVRVERIGSAIVFYQSSDGISFSPNGTATLSGSLFDSTSAVEIGSYNAGTQNLGAARCRRIEITAAGSPVLDIDFTAWTAQTGTALTGQTVTLAGAAQIIEPGALMAPVTAGQRPTQVTSDGVTMFNVSGNSITIANPNNPDALSHTITYADNTTDTYSPSGATLTFPRTDAKFAGKTVKRLLSSDGKIDFVVTIGLTQSAWTNSGTAGGSATINRASTGLKTVVKTATDPKTLVFDGTDDYASAADHDLLDFGSGQSGTVVALARKHGTTTTTTRQQIVGKLSAISFPTAGWSLYARLNTGEYNLGAAFSSAATGIVDNTAADTVVDARLSLFAGVFTSGTGSEGFVDAASNGATASASAIDQSNSLPVYVGAVNAGAANQIAGEISGVALFRHAPAQADNLKRIRWALVYRASRN